MALPSPFELALSGLLSGARTPPRLPAPGAFQLPALLGSLAGPQAALGAYAAAARPALGFRPNRQAMVAPSDGSGPPAPPPPPRPARPALQPEDTGLEPGRVLMTYRGGQPVYYGSPESVQAAQEGYQRVVAHYGPHSPAARRAFLSLIGVLRAAGLPENVPYTLP